MEGELRFLYNEFFMQGAFTIAGLMAKRSCMNLVSLRSNPLELLRAFQTGLDDEDEQRYEDYRTFDRHFRMHHQDEIELYCAVERLLDVFNWKVRAGEFAGKKAEVNKSKILFIESRFAQKSISEIKAEYPKELDVSSQALSSKLNRTQEKLLDYMCSGTFSSQLGYDFRSEKAYLTASRLLGEVRAGKLSNPLKNVRRVEKGIGAVEKYGYGSIDEALIELEERIRELRREDRTNPMKSYIHERLDTLAETDECGENVTFTSKDAPRCKGYELIIDGKVAAVAARPEFVLKTDMPYTFYGTPSDCYIRAIRDGDDASDAIWLGRKLSAGGQLLKLTNERTSALENLLEAYVGYYANQSATKDYLSRKVYETNIKDLKDSRHARQSYMWILSMMCDSLRC